VHLLRASNQAETGSTPFEITLNEKQTEKALSSIRESLEPASNSTVSSNLHCAKHISPRTVSAAGMVIEESFWQSAKADLGKAVNFEPASSFTSQSARQPEKHSGGRSSIEAAM
jgi:hypothetical protein